VDKSRSTSPVRRFLRARQGATAVEFALILMPFLLLLMAIIELSLIFVVTVGLDGATTAAARQIRTGSFQLSGASTKTDFRNLVCSKLPVLPSGCDANVFVDVRTFNTFADLSANFAQSGATFVDSATCFSPGKARDIVLVRVYYQWPLVTPGVMMAFADNPATGQRMLSSASVFRNEPYNDDPPVGAKCT